MRARNPSTRLANRLASTRRLASASRFAIATAVALGVGCGGGGDPKEYAKQQAKKADEGKPKGKVIKVETPVKGGTKIACDVLLDAAKLGELLEEKDGVSINDQTKGEREATSVCSIRKGGEVLGEKEQEKLAGENLRMGAIAGDEICNVGAFCSLPPDPDLLKRQCEQQAERQGNTRTSNALGVYACVQIVPKGADDSYTYKFIDPDTKCTMRVRAGPSIAEEAVVQKCAKAVMDLIGPDQLR